MPQEINLFWRQTRSPSLREQEKENNVTHAFLILLLKNHGLLNKILKKCKLPAIDNKSKEIFFQVSKKHRSKTLDHKNKYVLFIRSKYNESEDISKAKKEKEKDIPDGLIIDKDTAIIIEAKVSASKSQSQIDRYNRTFFKNLGIVKNITWEDIYNFIPLDKTKDSIEKYLSTQFREYLEMVHLNGFSGIPFFDKNEIYNREDASYTMKFLIKELKEKEWFKNREFIIRERPKTSPWDFWNYKDVEEDNPRKFPHYSVYIFDKFFAVDCLFHKKELKKILKDKDLFKKFSNYLLKLSKDSPDYFFRAVHYKLLQNKETPGARQGASYHDLEFIFQINRFIKKHKMWEKQLRSYLELLMKEKIKQFSIIKKAHYEDKVYNNLTNPAPCFGFINEVLDETIKFYDFIYGLYKNK